MKQYYSNFIFECGLDEVGRGCLAGPVVAAGVILPKDYKNSQIKDSKKLNEKKRESLYNEIIANCIDYSIQAISPKEIDSINILQASILAMHKCVDKLNQKPEFLLVDGNKFNSYKNIPHQCIIKGDSKFLNIAAASILAKVHRDNLMKKLAAEYPQFDWENNKGYPTKKHRAAIQRYGSTPHHRMSFKLLVS